MENLKPLNEENFKDLEEIRKRKELRKGYSKKIDTYWMSRKYG